MIKSVRFLTASKHRGSFEARPLRMTFPISPAVDRGGPQAAGLQSREQRNSSPAERSDAGEVPSAARRRGRADSAGERRGFFLFLLYSLLFPTLASAERHPQDGPHCEVVVRIREQGVEVRLSPNLVFLDTLFDFPREDPGAIAPAEVWTLRDLLAAHFATPANFPIVSIDGSEPQPELGEILVNAPDAELLALFPNSGMRGLRKIAFTLEYPTNSLPQEVALRWRDFPPNTLSLFDELPPLVITVELLTPGKRDLIDLTQQEPEFIWHAPTPEESAAASIAVPASPPPPAARTLALLPVVACTGGAIMAAVLLQRGWRRGGLAAVLVLAATATVAAIGRSTWQVEIAREDSPMPNADEAVAIFKPLQRGIYAAFDLDEEGDVYDALAANVDGPLLPRVYRSVRRSLVMEEEGGAVGRVIGVRPIEIEIESIGLVEPPRDPAPLVAGEGEAAGAATRDGSGPGTASSPSLADSSGIAATEAGPRDALRVGFTVRCTWQVDGAVYHWGHGHFRTNEYEGRFLVIATDRGWRIAGDELLSQRRVDEPEKSIDDNDPASGAPSQDDEEFEV